MIKWAGWIFTVLGTGHLLLTLALVGPHHAAAWFGGELWMPEGTIAEMPAAAGGFWLSVGSFGLPLLVIGQTVLWMHRRAITPPAFIAWAVGAWSVVAGLIFEPAPWIVATIGAGLLLAGVTRAARAQPEAALSR
jgi:hypothetical protein